MKRKVLLFIFTLILVLTGITNINAYDKYDGDYTLEYLLKNYNVVTLGTKERYNYSVTGNTEKTKGSVTNVFDIGGPVLIRGNYTGSTNLKWDNEFAQKTNCIPSYIKGKIGDKIKAGSIESAELSNIYVGSSNKVTNNNGYYTVNNDTYKYKYPVKVSDDYVDFDKLYATIVNEQSKIASDGERLYETGENESHGGDSGKKITIDKPGNYTIEDLDEVNRIYLNNYDPNKLYIINTPSDSVYSMPIIFINDSKNEAISKSGDVVYCGREDNNEDCLGSNIIWNFKNARYIHTNYSTMGHIVAPKADIDLTETSYPGAIIANSITSESGKYTAIQFYPYDLKDKIVNVQNETMIKEETDVNPNDLYDGNYSIDELLKNYSVVTLGTNEYSSSARLRTLTAAKGTAVIFHVAGQFLINGDLGVNSVFYPEQNSGDLDGIRLDLNYENEYYSSYIKGALKISAYDAPLLERWRYMGIIKSIANHKYRLPDNLSIYETINTKIYFGSSNSITPNDNMAYKYSFRPTITNGNAILRTNHSLYNSDNYIDFGTLYDAIVEQQKKIEKGTIINASSYSYLDTIHVPIGGNYTIEGISGVRHLKFKNYEKNKDKLTIVTINDSGTVTLPIVFGEKSDGNCVSTYTNDWRGKEKRSYESEVIQPETYYGNIVWNIPNATQIKFTDGTPFIGHIIAPNADVETHQFHFAGAMICNSLYTEGHSEAHFYPLTVGSVGTGIKKETKTIGGEVEKITISGTKTWDDNNNQDGLRPESVTINLLANGEKVDSITITESDNWKYSFSVPRVDENGIKINYTITEDAIEHYATKIESFSNDTCPSGCKVSIDGYNITNSYTPKKTSLTVNKVWKDENNADKLRPESVEVELYANGEKVTSATLNEENNWTYIFNEIDMNENGNKIEYTVKEKEKIKGYTTSISGDQETGYTITNTHVVKKVNPTTGDTIKRFLFISIISAGLLALSVILFTKYRRKKA